MSNLFFWIIILSFLIPMAMRMYRKSVARRNHEQSFSGRYPEQFPITDDAALVFSEAVYRRLAAGDSMDAAVAEGRLALLRRMPDSLEWGTPVLFLRAADSRLLRPSAVELPVRPRRKAPSKHSKQEILCP